MIDDGDSQSERQDGRISLKRWIGRGIRVRRRKSRIGQRIGSGRHVRHRIGIAPRRKIRHRGIALRRQLGKRIRRALKQWQCAASRKSAGRGEHDN